MTERAKHPGQKNDRPRGVVSRRPGVGRRTVKAEDGFECRDCGLVQHQGKWTSDAPASGRSARGRCPACMRIRDHDPAGTLTMPARFLAQRDEVLGLIRNAEATEKAEHPLERLMKIEESEGHLVVTTTGVHLARKIAHTLAKRFHAKPRFRYAEGEDLVHVDWEEPGRRSKSRKER